MINFVVQFLKLKKKLVFMQMLPLKILSVFLLSHATGKQEIMKELSVDLAALPSPCFRDGGNIDKITIE